MFNIDKPYWAHTAYGRSTVELQSSNRDESAASLVRSDSYGRQQCLRALIPELFPSSRQLVPSPGCPIMGRSADRKRQGVAALAWVPSRQTTAWPEACRSQSRSPGRAWQAWLHFGTSTGRRAGKKRHGISQPVGRADPRQHRGDERPLRRTPKEAWPSPHQRASVSAYGAAALRPCCLRACLSTSSNC